MSYMKRAMEELQARGWPVDNQSLKRLEETIRKENNKSVREWIDSKDSKNGKSRENRCDGKIS